VPKRSDLFGGSPLAASGHQITAIVLDTDVVVLLGRNREHELRIESDMRLTLHDGRDVIVHYDPLPLDSLLPFHISMLASIAYRTPREVLAFVDGALALEFADGPVERLVVEPDPSYEAWTYTNGSYILSCPPGGFAREHES
jgi:hypothetical protein